MMHLGGVIARNARYRPDHEAVVFEDARLTWREFATRVNRASGALIALGMSKGDVLALVTPNCLELLELYWAAAQTGVVVVPLSPLLRGNGLLSLLRDSGATAVVASAELIPVLEEIRDELPSIVDGRWLVTDAPHCSRYRHYGTVAAESADSAPSAALNGADVYNIIYSSGTTGLPKGIVHTHLIRSTYCTTFASAFRMTPESVVMHAGSLIFNGAFVTMMPAFFLGARYILKARFDAQDFLETVRREQVTHVMMVPSQIAAILDEPDCSRASFASIQMLCSVGAPLPVSHKERLRAVAPGALYELYGLTEGFVTILDRHDYDCKLGSVGIPAYFNEMRIIGDDGCAVPPGTVGEITGRGPLLMPGYHGRPDLTAEAIVDGWLHTGDLGFVDDDGFLFLVDRKKDLIISGGVNVYPKDIEEVLAQHPAVREAAVFGVPHEKWGEAPMGAVILKANAAIDPEALRAWANARVAARYQQLRELLIVTDFPRSVSGKTLKRLLRDPYWKGRASRI